MSFEVFVAGAQKAFPCRDDQTVLAAMSHSGTACVQVGCRSGGCGVCRVQVLAGSFDCGLMSAAQVSSTDRAAGIVLACQLFPRSDLQVCVLGRSGSEAGDSTLALIRGLSTNLRNETKPGVHA